LKGKYKANLTLVNKYAAKNGVPQQPKQNQPHLPTEDPEEGAVTARKIDEQLKWLDDFVQVKELSLVSARRKGTMMNKTFGNTVG
jgi:hypothetical protein